MSSEHRLDALPDLPEEIIDLIVCQLDFDSVCSMRLASRLVSAKSCNGFRVYFYQKTIVLADQKQLQLFSDMTQPHNMGRFLKSLTITEEVDGLRERPSHDTSVAALLPALKNLQLHSRRHHLEALTLEVQVQPTDENNISGQRNDVVHTWNTATYVYQVSMQALRDCNLVVETLNVFEGIQCCSLACDLLQIGPLASLHRLKKLSLSLSHRLIDGAAGQPSHSPVSAANVTFARSFERLLEALPQLETLRLHWYNLRSGDDPDAHFLNFLERSPQFASLKECSLRGIFANATSLVRFLQNARLSSITLEAIHLGDGCFQTLFDHLVTTCPLDHLYLDSLYEEKVIFFKGPNRAHIATSGRCGQNDLERNGAEARRPINYRISSGRALGSSRLFPWLRTLRLDYGPWR